MAKKDRTQLNINIEPELLVRLKSEAIKSGKTLTEFVINKLKQVSESSSDDDRLEKRLLKIEQFLMLDEKFSKQEKQIGTIFTDEGAKNYGQVAKKLFESHLKKKGLDTNSGLQEIARHLQNYPYGNPELIFQILLGNHHLTGLEMTIAYRHGSCSMRSALNDWTNEPLEELNEAFLNAVITKSLA